MRPGARLLARVSAAPAEPHDAVRPFMSVPSPTTPRAHDGRVVETLRTAVEAQLVTVEALVSATQAQVQALIGLKSVAIGDGEATGELARVQAVVSSLSAQLGSDAEDVRAAALATQREFHLGDAPLTLATLVGRLPLLFRRDLEDRVSALRSLAQSLQELQRVAQIHAHRGLTALSAWRTVLGAPSSEAGTTYSRTGRARLRPTQASSVDLDL
jgi:hypothetical protein